MTTPVPLFPFLGSYDEMASPSSAGAASPAWGSRSSAQIFFFCGVGGFFFSVMGGVSAANRQTAGQIPGHHWLLTGWDSHSREVGPVWGCKGSQSGLGCQ